MNRMKRFFKKAIAVVLVCVMMGAFVGEVLPQKAFAAAASLDYIETIKADKRGKDGVAGEKYVILEVVPDEMQGAMGYYVAGSEPTKAWMNLAAEMTTQTERLEFMDSVRAGLVNRGLLSASTTTPLTLASDASFYTELYPWETAEDLESFSSAVLNTTAEDTIVGTFSSAEEEGGGQFILDAAQSAYKLAEDIDGDGEPDGEYDIMLDHFKRADNVEADGNFYYLVQFKAIEKYADIEYGTHVYRGVKAETEEAPDVNEPEDTNTEEVSTESEVETDSSSEEPAIDAEPMPVDVEDEELSLNGETADEAEPALDTETEEQTEPEDLEEPETEEQSEPEDQESEDEEQTEPEVNNEGEEAESGEEISEAIEAEDPDAEETESSEEETEEPDAFFEYVDLHTEDNPIDLDDRYTYYTVEAILDGPSQHYQDAEAEYTQWCVAVYNGFTKVDEGGAFDIDAKAFSYVGSGGSYVYSPEGSESYSVSYQSIYYKFSFTNNNWFLRYVLDCTDEDLESIAATVWSYTPEQLDRRQGSIVNSDLIVVTKGFSPLDGTLTGFDAENDLTAACTKSIQELVSERARDKRPLVIDAALKSTEAANINVLINELYAVADEDVLTEGGTNQNVYFYKPSDFGVSSLANASFYSAAHNVSTTVDDAGNRIADKTDPYSAVLQAIISTNESRTKSGEELLDETVSQAACIRQIIDFPGQLIGNKKDVLRVLMIQPMKEGYVFDDAAFTMVDADANEEELKDAVGYTATRFNAKTGQDEAKTFYGEEAAAEYIRDHYLPSADNDYTTTKIRDIRITVKSVSIKEFIGRTEDLISNYDMIILGASTEGFAVDGSGKTIFNDSTYLKNGWLYAAVGDTYDGNVVPQDWTWDAGDYSTKNVYRTSGNDLTAVRLEELKTFAEAGLPVVVSDKLVKLQNTGDQLPCYVELNMLDENGNPVQEANGKRVGYEYYANFGARLVVNGAFNPDDYSILCHWYMKAGRARPYEEADDITTADDAFSEYEFHFDQRAATERYWFRCDMVVTSKATGASTTVSSNTICLQPESHIDYYTLSYDMSNQYSEGSIFNRKYYRDYTLEFNTDIPADVEVHYSWSRTKLLSFTAYGAADTPNQIKVSDDYYYVCDVTTTGFDNAGTHRFSSSPLVGGGIQNMIYYRSTFTVKRSAIDESPAPSGILPKGEARVTANTDIIDPDTYLYQFIDEYYQVENTPNVLSEKDVTKAYPKDGDPSVDLETGRKNILVYLNNCSCPEMTVTNVGGFGYESTRPTADDPQYDEKYANRYESKRDEVVELTDSAIQINFNLDNPTDPKPVSTRYTFHFYIDRDGDGFFSDEEEIEDAVINWSAVAGDELKAGETYSLYYPLSSADEGILPWMLELVKNGQGKVKYVHASEYGYCYYEPTTPDEIHVLQICADSDATGGSAPQPGDTVSKTEKSGSGTRNNPIVTTNVTENHYTVVDKVISSVLSDTSSSFYTLLSQLEGASVTYKDVYKNTTTSTGRTTVTQNTTYDRTTRTYTKIQTRTDTVQDHYIRSPHVEGYVGLEGHKKDYLLSVDLKLASDINSEEDLRYTFTDEDGYEASAEYDVVIVGFGASYEELGEAGSKLIADWMKKDKAVICTHDSLSAVQIYDETKHTTSRQYYATKALRPGLNLLFKTETQRTPSEQRLESFLDRLGIIGRITNWFIPKTFENELYGYTRHTITRYMNQESSAGVFSGSNGLIGLLEFVWHQLFGPGRLDKPSDLSVRPAATTDTITEMNKGRVTTYPYNVNMDKVIVSETWEPYYLLDLNYADTSVWYCLASGTAIEDQEPYYQPFYDDVKNDAMNCYYMYNIQATYYFGGGLTNSFTTDEAKLLINTFVAAYNTAKYLAEKEDIVKKPSVNFIDDSGVTKTSMMIAGDTSGESTSNLSFMTEEEITVRFRVRGEGDAYTVRFYDNNSETPLTDHIRVRYTDSDGNVHETSDLSALAPGEYTLVLFDPDASGSLLEDLLGSSSSAILAIEAIDADYVGSDQAALYTSNRSKLSLREYGLRNLS